MKSRVIDNPLDEDKIDLIIDTALGEKVALGKESNFYHRFTWTAAEWMNNWIKPTVPEEGMWKFDYMNSSYNILYHNDIIEGNNGGLGCIIPLEWENQDPQTIMLKHWDTRRLMYCGDDRCEYVDTKEKADFKCSELEEDLVFNWDRSKMLIFDVTQLHTASRFDKAWKTFFLGFLV